MRERGWLDSADFEDALGACNMLPGPASTQLAIYCAWRVRGRAGALLGGLAFIAPGLLLILALSALFLAGSPPRAVRAVGAGAGSAVAAVAVSAGMALLPARFARARGSAGMRLLFYIAAGGAAAATLGGWLVLVLFGCGFVELALRRPGGTAGLRSGVLGGLRPGVLGTHAASAGGLGSLAWVAVKVGALSYGGGFVIVPLMQGDAVGRYHWMTSGQFLNAVALGQVTPGPVVQTVAAVGYAAAGVGGGLLAAAIAFSPSFAVVLLGGPRFDRLRASARARAFLDGAAPAAIGAILGAAIPLAIALQEAWQGVVLAAAALVLLVLRRGVVLTLLLAAACGLLALAAGAPIPR